MPTYQYRCTNCGHEIEAVQKFSDPALTTCDQCQGQLRKVFSPVGVVFKGSGFYATDSRSKKTASTGAGTTTASSNDPAGGSTGEASTTSSDKAASGTPAPTSTPSSTAPSGGSASGSTTSTGN